MKLAIVIPAYNEEKRIGETLREYVKFFDGKVGAGFDYDILVSVNNTTDRTIEIIEGLSKKNKKISYLNLPLGGKGYAVIEGFRESLKKNYDYIGFVDADMATSPEEYYKLARNIGDYDGIIASRYVRGSKVHPPNTFRRIVVSRIFNFLVRVLFFIPYKDTQCGAKIFNKRAAEIIALGTKNSQWAFDVEILANLKKNSLRVKEHPTVWYDKEYSKINFWRAGPSMALGVIKMRFVYLKSKA